MLDGYIYYYAWFALVLNFIVILIPGVQDETSSQTVRIIRFMLILPLLGRLIGWW